MRLDEYQTEAAKFADYQGQGERLGLLYCCVGLSEESGEVCGKMKKHLRDDFTDSIPTARAEALKFELGDVLWFISELSRQLGYDLSEIAAENLQKLEKRYSRNQQHGEGDYR